MERSRHRLVFALLAGALFLAPLRPARGADGACWDAFRRIGLYTVGALSEVPDYPMRLVSRLHQTLKASRGEDAFFYTAHRGVLRYLLHLRLLSYDFSGKRVLDVGANRNGFAPVVNWLYGRTGTRVVSVDRYSTPFSPGVVADAADLPLAGRSFDLTLSNWMLPYFWGTGREYRILSEMMRVTREGGEIHFSTSAGLDSGEVVAWLRSHPRVAEVRTPWLSPLAPFTRPIVVKLRGSDSDPRSRSDAATRARRTLGEGTDAGEIRTALAHLVEEEPGSLPDVLMRLPGERRNELLGLALGERALADRATDLSQRIVSVLVRDGNRWWESRADTALLLMRLEGSLDYPKLDMDAIAHAGGELRRLQSWTGRLLPKALSRVGELARTSGNLRHFLSSLSGMPGVDIVPALDHVLLRADYDAARAVQGSLKALRQSHPEALPAIRRVLYGKSYVYAEYQDDRTGAPRIERRALRPEDEDR